MRPSFPATDLYAITDDALSLGRSVETVAAALLAADVKILQYREKRKKAGDRLRECLRLRAMTREAGACFIVNDYLDIALLSDADGVHVGQEDLPVSEIRRLAGDRLLIGVSTHSPAQAARAAAEGADYIGVGPLFATRTKEDVCAPVGLEYLEHVAAVHKGLPFVAIGGIKRHNIGQVVSRGALCCCLVSELVGAPDIPARVAEVRRAISLQTCPSTG
jgi:thiamine-phosphate pyrophosphorylase